MMETLDTNTFRIYHGSNREHRKTISSVIDKIQAAEGDLNVVYVDGRKIVSYRHLVAGLTRAAQNMQNAKNQSKDPCKEALHCLSPTSKMKESLPSMSHHIDSDAPVIAIVWGSQGPERLSTLDEALAIEAIETKQDVATINGLIQQTRDLSMIKDSMGMDVLEEQLPNAIELGMLTRLAAKHL